MAFKFVNLPLIKVNLLLESERINKRIGILGGGQLGKMLCQAGSRLGLKLKVMDADTSFPCATVCPDFVCGDIRDYDDVLAFGHAVDIITVEIEDVNIRALETLESLGKSVYPQPAVLKVIKDKGLQKMFYEASGLPSAAFSLYKDKATIMQMLDSGNLNPPFVQKLRTGGYDGRGVQIVKNREDISSLMEGPSVIEELADVEKEISVIAARNEMGEMAVYDAAEMEFHAGANLAECIFSPSGIDAHTADTAAALARETAERLGIVGLLAVEMFVTKDGNVVVNEAAPRPHNSGHHTIEACITSQYEMHLRAILGLPLGSTEQLLPAVTVNLLGEAGYSGPAKYTGLEDALALPGVHPHLYGKKETRPFRKMGHVTITDRELQKALNTAKKIKEFIKIIS